MSYEVQTKNLLSDEREFRKAFLRPTLGAAIATATKFRNDYGAPTRILKDREVVWESEKESGWQNG